jgi:CubicO group peptidase (beta-lactamase class C family)
MSPLEQIFTWNLFNIMRTDNFSAAHQVLRQAVDRQFLAGASAVVSVQGQVVDSFCTGHADIESRRIFSASTICRAFSNTKLAATMLVMKLVEGGQITLDTPVKNWIPGFGRVQVLKAGAARAADTEALRCDITVRQLLSHQGGLVHAVFDPNAMLYKAYRAAGIRGTDTNLAELMDLLVNQPLSFQPGHGWEYGMGLDVMARVVEIITGLDWPAALRKHLFDPLGMVDTAHLVRPSERSRLATLYTGPDIFKPFQPGLMVASDIPWPMANLEPVRRCAGGGGLVTTQDDWLRLMHQLLPGTSTYLNASTLAEMFRDQLAPDTHLRFAHMGPLPQFGYGLGGAYTRRASALQPHAPTGELQWGGLGGTHWCIDPARGICIVQMAQRHFGFWNPFWFDYKAAVYQALG